MVSEITIAVIQLYSKPLDVAGNFARAESFIRRAASQGADLAVLPEYHLQSWRADRAALLAAARKSAPYLDKYRSLARELRIAIVPGTILEVTRAPAPEGSRQQTVILLQPENDDDQQQQQIANAAYFIGADGIVRARYQKKNLWHPERPILTADADTPHQAFDYEPWGVRVGMLICWDLAFPEATRELAAQGAQLVVCPTCWLAGDNGEGGDAVNPLSEQVFVESVVVARAFENTCAIVLCNAGGPVGGEQGGEGEEGEGEEEGEVRFLGLSQVAMPMLGALGKLGSEEGMSVARVDLGVLDIAEEAYKMRADMAKEGWHYAHTLRDVTGKGRATS
ncbi:Hydrolase in pqqF 5'region [Escovopsis weberi]|uniref:Hydrolase in pqqF 5'region n=1 Tax=Escovopsis weberi TaxID=150374 RepID=A0A0M8N437_ESCWE|nr:Hydrolase in pqqF 5'region [Escovopsis weberi]